MVTCKMILPFESVDETTSFTMYNFQSKYYKKRRFDDVIVPVNISGLNLFLSVVSLWTLYYYWHLDFLEW